MAIVAELVGLHGFPGAVQLFGFLMVAYITMLLPLQIMWRLGLQTIARRQQVEQSKRDWTFFYSSYLLGTIAFTKAAGIIMVLAAFLAFMSLVFGLISLPVGQVALAIFLVLTLAGLYRTYKKMSQRAWGMIIWTLVSFGLLAPIFLFNIRNNPLEQAIERPAADQL